MIGLWTFLRALFLEPATVALENLALGHQLVVLQRSVVPRPRLLAWHRKGFHLYWRWKSRPNPVGRPRLNAAIRQLIRRLARENRPGATAHPGGARTPRIRRR